MDDIGNILFIVLALIIGIFKAITGNNKQKELKRRRLEEMENERMEEKPSVDKNPLETIFDNLEDMMGYEENEDEEEEVVEVEKNEYVENRLENTLSDKSDERKYRPMKYNIYKNDSDEDENDDAEPILLEQEISTGEASSSLSDKDGTEKDQSIYIADLLKDSNDLKKAVILSEILNRKY